MTQPAIEVSNVVEKRRTHPALIYGRHLVALAIVAVGLGLRTNDPYPAAYGIGYFIGAVLFAAAIAGLITLFFTKSQARHTARNFAIAAWLLMLMVAVNPWVTRKLQERENRDHWRDRVTALRQAISTGSLPVIEADMPSYALDPAAAWRQADVDVLEANQNWWIDGGSTYLHLQNVTANTLAAVEFEYMDQPCGMNGTRSVGQLQLQREISPSTRAVVRFASAGWMKAKAGCLIVRRAWAGTK